MKRLPKDPSKILELKGLSHLPMRIRRWDLLLVDDHGKVLSFQHIKGLVIFFMILLMLSLGVSVFLFYLYKNTQVKMGELRITLENSRKHATVMQQETRDLMVRLAEAQTKVPKRPKQKVPASEKKKVSSVKAPPPGLPVADKADKPRNTAKPGSGSPDTGAAPSIMKIAVGAFDFSAAYDPELNGVQVRFIIKNINRNVSVVQGYIFAIMKTNSSDQQGWFPTPPVALIAGRPGDVKAGQYFKIRNYKTITLRSETLTGPNRFEQVSVLIYSTTGVLLLEKTYPVDIDVPGKTDTAPPAAGPDAVVQTPEKVPPENPAATDPDPEKTDIQTVIPLPAQDKDPVAKPGEAIHE